MLDGDANEKHTAPDPRAMMSGTSRHAHLVLVADDYDDSAEMLAGIIETTTDFDTIWVTDGQQALDAARKSRPAACLLDIHMPKLDGIEVARTLREEFGDDRPLLIAVTGGGADAAITSKIFDHVLKKPIDLDHVVRLLRA